MEETEKEKVIIGYTETTKSGKYHCNLEFCNVADAFLYMNDIRIAVKHNSRKDSYVSISKDTPTVFEFYTIHSYIRYELIVKYNVLDKILGTNDSKGRETIVVNLFGGPGCGKSTSATYIFSKLKMMGISCEYVSEFAKDIVWEGNNSALKNQFYISGNQSYRISRLIGKVDVIITDSPIAIGALYGENVSDNLKRAIIDEFNKFNNINYFIDRNKFTCDNEGRLRNEATYDTEGRIHSEEEAKYIDCYILEMLTLERIFYKSINKNELDNVIIDIASKVKKQDD